MWRSRHPPLGLIGARLRLSASTALGLSGARPLHRSLAANVLHRFSARSCRCPTASAVSRRSSAKSIPHSACQELGLSFSQALQRLTCPALGLCFVSWPPMRSTASMLGVSGARLRQQSATPAPDRSSARRITRRPLRSSSSSALGLSIVGPLQCLASPSFGLSGAQPF